MYILRFSILTFSICCLPLVAAAQEVSVEAGVPSFITSDDDPQTSDYWACFSPDGKTVLFSRRKGPRSKWELFTVSTTGGDARRLNANPLPVSATRASWSKENGIAFTGGTRDRKQQLWLINPDGANAKQVRIQGLSDLIFYPSWYSNGKKLAVLDAGNKILQLVDLQKNTIAPLTDASEVLVGMPNVSPDGETVAFAGQKNNGQKYDQTKNNIWLVSVDEVRRLEAAPLHGRTPAWSPDGKRIAFESNRGSQNPRLQAIFIADKSGENVKQLTPFGWNANHPVWSPDGNKIVFTARNPEQTRISGIAIMAFEP